MAENVFDLLVVGGGINGAGVARDAAGRGLGVLLVERGDLGGATSSASTKLIHGGLRYLEHREFRLVREALQEREVLLRLAPHLIRPLRFVLPHEPHLRPAWLIRLGLFLYDRLGGRTSLPGSRAVALPLPGGPPVLREGFTRGFVYSDAWVDDARLVIANAIGAAEKGADIRPRTTLVTARRDGPLWRATVQGIDGTQREVVARCVVNAAGPWVQDVRSRCLGLGPGKPVRLVKGSHIVVPRLAAGDDAYIFQQPDGRVVFAIPFPAGGTFTLIGTTDVPVDRPDGPEISPAETDYLCAAANRYFRAPVPPDMVVHRFAGIRPLFDDGAGDPSAVTRDYVVDLDAPDGLAPALSVYGGKITTYRRLAEQVLARLAHVMPGVGRAWTATEPLPGGGDPVATVVERTKRTRPDLPSGLVDALAHRHGDRIESVIGDARTLADLGRTFGGGLFQREVEWFRAREWALTPEDVLWRRTKCGLVMTVAERAAFAAAF